MKTVRVVVYVRVSTNEQAKHGYSIRAQIEKLKAFCVSQGWEIVEIFVDEGFSAKDLDRPKYREMEALIAQGEIDVLLVYKLDRLTRSILDLHQILAFLEQYGCNFRSATEQYDTTTAMGKLFITLVGAIAQWERENLAERIKMGRVKKVNEGKFVGGSTGYGYEYKKGELVPVPEEAKIIEEVFDMALDYTPLQIARKLTERGVKPPKSSTWNRDTIKNFLTNPTYAGYVMKDDEPRIYKSPAVMSKLIPAVHVAIVSKEKFWYVQRIIRERNNNIGRAGSGHYYFTSILYCNQCGRNYIAHKQRDKKGYRCSGQRSGNGCTNGTCGEDALVEAVFNEMKNTNILDIESPVESNTTNHDVEKMHRELEDLEKKRLKQIAMYELDLMTLEELKQKVNVIKDRKQEIYEELDKINQPRKIEKLNYIRENFQAIWEFAEEDERKEIMHSLFRKVVIDVKKGTGKKSTITIQHME